ncbi:hypothetical protein J6590_039495 [Homalodisca vitripennis]|nr:hypothetical protein J6590_039495 [Homalodisca vitripennis]
MTGMSGVHDCSIVDVNSSTRVSSGSGELDRCNEQTPRSNICLQLSTAVCCEQLIAADSPQPSVLSTALFPAFLHLFAITSDVTCAVATALSKGNF